MMAAAGILLSSMGEVSGEMSSTQAGKIAAEAVKGMEEGLVKQQAHQAALKAAQVVKFMNIFSFTFANQGRILGSL